VKLLKRTDLRAREAIAINYGMIRQWLLKTYPYAFRLIDKVKSIERSQSLDIAFEYIYCQEDMFNYEKELNRPLNDILRDLEYIGKFHFNNKSFNPFHSGMFVDPKEVPFPDIK
jgi:hypothetical protein